MLSKYGNRRAVQRDWEMVHWKVPIGGFCAVLTKRRIKAQMYIPLIDEITDSMGRTLNANVHFGGYNRK